MLLLQLFKKPDFFCGNSKTIFRINFPSCFKVGRVIAHSGKSTEYLMNRLKPE